MTDVIRRCSCGTELLTKCNKCKPCAREITNARRKRLLEAGHSKQDVYNYTWREKNTESYLVQTAKSRAKKKGLAFDITAEDVVIPEFCPVLGIPLFIQIGGEGVGKNDNNPSLDRIDSDKGYIKGNVQVISWRANNLKADGTLEEFIKLVEFLKHG